MGGYFSTRWNLELTRQDTGGLLFLDVRTLNRQGALQRGAVASQYWARGDGEPAGTITTSCDGRTLTLDYRARAYGDTNWTPVRETVHLDTTPCHFGGERVWFRCPACHSRRAVLSSASGIFACRECHRLAYTSTREPVQDRCIRRCVAIQKRLGGGGYGVPVWQLPPKPKGMHWSTYERLVFELRIAILRREARFGAKLKAMASTWDRLLVEREQLRR